MRDPEKTVGGMADKAKTVYLSYIDSRGFPTTRAMLAPREREDVRVFWFSTNTSSQKVAAFRRNPKGSIYFVDRLFFGALASPALWRCWRTRRAKNASGGAETPCITLGASRTRTIAC